MRYREIIETKTNGALKAQRVWDQTKKGNEALRKLRSKQQDLNDAKAAAKSLPPGEARDRKLKATDRHDAEARRIYGDALSSANAAAAKALSAK